MQAYTAAWDTRRSLAVLVIVVLFLLLGAALGYSLRQGAVREATLAIRVENDTSLTQEIRILANGGEIGRLTLGPLDIGSLRWRVGWTNTENAVYEVRAVPTFGAPDGERVTVMNGATVIVELRVG